MTSRRIRHRTPFDLRTGDGRPDMGIRELGVVVLPVILSRIEMARVFGKSETWIDGYLKGEGKVLDAAKRQINGRNVWLTKTVLDYIDGRVL